ncbi:MAG: DNA-binding response regulator [Bacteroidetes bacterium]|nr:MAG: DNA-binding response regulator [Bacteroidota bacterium]
MKPIRTLLVDDEYLALNLLENYVNNVPDMVIVGKVKSAMQALEILNSQPVDLMFLDIQMPTLSGNNLLKTLSNPPVTIFTTAYADYAVEAFSLNAVDYLLKPFPFERFLQAVNKAREHILRRTPSENAPLTQPDQQGSLQHRPFYAARIDGKMVRIFFDEILFVEGLKEYVRFVCESGKKYVVLESLKNLEELLPSAQFMRVHKSFIVAKDRVLASYGHVLELKDHVIPISRSKKEEVLQKLFSQGGQDGDRKS